MRADYRRDAAEDAGLILMADFSLKSLEQAHRFGGIQRLNKPFSVSVQRGDFVELQTTRQRSA